MPHLCNGNFIFVVNACGMGSFLKFIGSSLQLQFSGIGRIINNKISGPGPTMPVTVGLASPKLSWGLQIKVGVMWSSNMAALRAG